MDSFMNSIKHAAASSVTGGAEKPTNSDQSSHSDLVSNAKLVAEAARLAAANQSEKIDKPKVAGAAADLLDSAKKYGKFDEGQGVGKYLKQADDYLHQYEKSGGGGGGSGAPAAAAAAEGKRKAEEEEVKSGGGFGAAEAFKAAGSFFK